MLNEDFLTENLSGDAKKKFLDFCNAWGVVNGESNLDSFIMGFCHRVTEIINHELIYT